MSTTFFLLREDGDGDACEIVSELPEQPVMPDPDPGYRLVQRSVLRALSGPELVKIANTLILSRALTDEKAVTRFADKDAGVKRVLALWDGAQAPPTSTPNTTEDSPKETTVAKAKKTKTPKAKKPAGEKKGRKLKELSGTIAITKKAEGKRWQEKSKRYAAFKILEANAPIEVDDAVKKIMTKLDVNRAQALGFLFKIAEVKVIEVKAK